VLALHSHPHCALLSVLSSLVIRSSFTSPFSRSLEACPSPMATPSPSLKIARRWSPSLSPLHLINQSKQSIYVPAEHCIPAVLPEHRINQEVAILLALSNTTTRPHLHILYAFPNPSSPLANTQNQTKFARPRV